MQRNATRATTRRQQGEILAAAALAPHLTPWCNDRSPFSDLIRGKMNRWQLFCACRTVTRLVCRAESGVQAAGGAMVRGARSKQLVQGHASFKAIAQSHCQPQGLAAVSLTALCLYLSSQLCLCFRLERCRVAFTSSEDPVLRNKYQHKPEIVGLG